MRYRVSYPEKLAVFDLVNGNPYLWDRKLPPESRKLYAEAWLWFKPTTQDQHDLRSLYLNDAQADFGPTVSFSLSRFLIAWGALFTVVFAIGKLIQIALDSAR